MLRVDPGDDLRVDGSVDISLAGEDAFPQYCSSVVTLFFFFREGQRVVTA